VASAWAQGAEEVAFDGEPTPAHLDSDTAAAALDGGADAEPMPTPPDDDVAAGAFNEASSDEPTPTPADAAASEAEAEQATSAEPSGPPDAAAAPAPRPAVSSELTYGENMICGSVARLAASVVLHPFDTLRTRAQARKRAQPGGARFGAADIFLKGIVPQVALAMPAGALQFATLEAARDGLSSPALASRVALNKPAKDLIASALGALAASLIRVPQEVLKQPVQAGLYANSAAAARAVWRGGPARLYRGFGATVLRDVPWNSLGYTFFRALKLALRAPDDAVWDMALAAAGGGLAAIILTPMDVAKTRLMTQSSADAVQYSGVFNTLGRVLREEGVGALFRGVLPRTIYLAPLAAIVYAVYEEVARLLKKLKHARHAQ